MTTIKYISHHILDYGDTENIFVSVNELKKFSHKSWVKSHRVNTNYAENTIIKYNYRTIYDKLVSFRDVYILLKVNILILIEMQELRILQMTLM